MLASILAACGLNTRVRPAQAGSSARGAWAVALAVVLSTLAPAVAVAQSTGCVAINQGRLDHTSTFASGNLNSSTARFATSVSDQAINALRTPGATSDPAAGTAPYDGNVYTFAAGERVTLSGTVSGFSGSGYIAGAIRRGTGASTVTESGGSLLFTADGTQSISYTIVGAETAIALRTYKSSIPSGQISVTATCTPPASPPTVTAVTPNSGPTTGGASVTIDGAGFSTFGNTVVIGGVSVTPSAESATSISFITPARAAGSVDVAVTTADSQTVTATNAYTYIATPTVTAVTPNNGSTAGGATVVLTGANLTGATAVTFGGTAATGFTVDSATQITATTPARAAGAVSVAVTTGGGTATLAGGFTYAAPPTVSSFTYGSIVAYNEGADQVTTLDLSMMTTGSTTGYAVGSATTAQGGSVSVNASGIASYTPPRGFRGNDSFIWTASNAAGTSTPATATVVVGDPTLSIYLSGSGVRGAPLSGVQIVAADGAAPYSCATTLASGALPAGVVLNANCSISGTPAASGNFSFTATVTDSSTGAGPFTAASGTLTLTVAAPTLTLSPAAGALPGATAGVAYSQTVTAGGGTAPYAISVTAGALPPGLTLSGGTLSGTPTTPGTFNFALTATDSSSAGSGGPYSVSKSYFITVGGPTITVAPTTLPNATVGTAYSQGVTASGGTAPYAYAITAGALPAGVSLASDGVLSGAPTANGTFNFTVTATDAGNFTGSRAYALSVAAPTVIVVPLSLANGQAGTAYSQTVAASGGTAPYNYAVTAGALPAGLSFSTSGALTGTPTAAGSFTFTVMATDSSTGTGPFSGSRSYTVTIAAPTITLAPTTLSAAMTGAAYSRTITASGGTAPYSYAVTAGALPAGVTLSPTGTLSGTPTAGGAFNFTVTATDAGGFTGARAYSLNVAAPTITLAPTTLPSGQAGAAYSQAVTASSGTAPYNYAVTAGALPPGLALSSSGNLSGTPTAAGTFNFTLRATDSSTGTGPYAGSRTYSLTISAPTIVLSPTTLPAATAGAAYNQAITASGGAAAHTYAIVAGALPAGVTLSTSGTLSGAPTAGGTFNFTVRAIDANGFTGARAYSLSVAAPTLTVAPTDLPGGQAGAAYSQTVTTSGGTAPYSYAVTAGALPSGLTLATNGTLSGTPTTVGTFNFTLTATDSSTGTGPYTGSRAYSVTISAPTIALSPATLPAATTGAAYSQAVAASGGSAPYSYAVTGGALPPGVTLSTSGMLSGTPTAGGVFNFTVTATEAGGFSGSRAYSLTVGGATIALAPTSLPGGSVAAAYAASLSASGGTAPYSYAVTAGALPPGLSLTSAGALTGTPTAVGTFSFTATASDSSTGVGAPFTGARAYTITIGQGAQTITFAPLSNASLSASPLTLSASASSGLTVGFVSETPAVCAVSGASLSLLQTGTCTVRAEQAGDADFAAAAPVSRGFAVTPAALTLSSASASGAVVGGAYSQANSAAGGVGPYVYALNTGALPPGVSLNAATGDVSGTPTTAGSFVYSIKVTDGQSPAVMTIGAPVNVMIAKGAQSVVFTSTAPAAVVAGPNYTPTATASSGLAVSFSLDPSSTGCVLSGGVISFTAPGSCVVNADQAGDANWNAASRIQQSFTVIANPPIVADRSNVAVSYGSPGTAIDLSGSITGGAHTSVDVTTTPAHGTVVIAGDVATYTPAAGYYGADSFAYTATGPGGTSGVATVRLTVGLPPAPTTAPRSVDVPYDSPGLDIDLSGAVGGVHSALSITAAPAHGQASVAGDVVTYRPTAGYYGADSFAYVATGPGGTSAPSTVTLTVAAPPAPVVTPPAAPVVAPPAQGGDGSVSVNLGSVSQGVVDGFRITVQSRFGRAEVVQAAQLTPASAAGSTSPQAAASVKLVYTPAPNFMGTDTVTVVAYGPGGDSAPASFTFQVAGKAPDLTANTASNASVRVAPTTGLVGGPFDGLRITRAPAFGTAVVDGLSIVFTPGAANGGSTSLDYVVDLPFGASAPGRLSLVSNAVPGTQTLTASTPQGVAVTTRISDTAGGPFTGAGVVSISPSSAGSAVISGSGADWDLTFTPSGAFSGQATVTFSLTNAFGTTNGTLAVTVEARPDPSQNAEVRGVASAQATSARRFADAQVDNFQRRLQSLRSGSNGSSNGLSLNLGLGGQSDLDNDPRTALRRQLGVQDRVEPGANADREREMLGLDVWAGRRDAAAQPLADVDPRLSIAPQTSSGSVRALGFWTAGSIDWGRQDAQGQRDSRFTTQGVTAGADVRISGSLIVGAGLGYGEDKTRIGDNGSVSEGAAVTGALYASWRPAEAFYVDGVLGYSDLEFDARRWTTGLGGQPDGYAMSERSGDVRFASASVGRLLERGGSVADLYARFDARQVGLDAFVETGAGLGSLSWDAATQDSLSANLGATLRWTMETRRLGVVAPTARLEWSHEFESLGAQGVRYADWAASPTYLVPLDGWSRDALRLGLGAEWSLTDRLLFSLGYRGSLGDAGSSQGGEFRLRYGW